MNFRSLVKKIIPPTLFAKIEPYGHWAEAILAEIIFMFPARKLKVIGVTGTDGKTSTATFIAHMLRANDHKVAMMTTISIDYGDDRGEQPNPTRLTTMGAFSLVSKLRKVKKSGAEWLVLETTSHALAQHRVWRIPYSIVVMTNINHEHLDYHGTFENYRAAKLMLFQQANKNTKGYRSGVINADDPSAEIFAKAIKYPFEYGINGGMARAENVKLSPTGSQYTTKIGQTEYFIKCYIPGSFNIYNSLAAVLVGHILAIPSDGVAKGIADLKAIEGRMTSVDEGQSFEVIVDYAHTPESFEKVFNEMKPLVKGRIIVVFGSAGRRDEEKRATQGEIAGKMADVVIVTEEDDRDADGLEIMKQIAEGAQNAGKVINKNLFLVHEREVAVEAAIDVALPGDLVLLLGKGHEKSILSNGPQAAQLRDLPQDDSDKRRVTKRYFDEVTSARQALQKRKGVSPSVQVSNT